MGQEQEGIFDYLLLLHIFSQFFCSDLSAPPVSEVPGVSEYWAFPRLCRKNIIIACGLLYIQREFSVSSNQLTYPSFTPFPLLSKCYCCTYSPPLCPQFYCLFCLPTAKCSGVFKSTWQPNTVYFNLPSKMKSLTSFIERTLKCSSWVTCPKLQGG